MSGFMIVGATASSDNGVDSFMLHVDQKPYVAATLEDAVETAVDYFLKDTSEYDDCSIEIDSNSITCYNDSVEVQYKIIALDGSEVVAFRLLEDEVVKH